MNPILEALSRNPTIYAVGGAAILAICQIVLAHLGRSVRNRILGPELAEREEASKLLRVALSNFQTDAAKLEALKAVLSHSGKHLRAESAIAERILDNVKQEAPQRVAYPTSRVVLRALQSIATIVFILSLVSIVPTWRTGSASNPTLDPKPTNSSVISEAAIPIPATQQAATTVVTLTRTNHLWNKELRIPLKGTFQSVTVGNFDNNVSLDFAFGDSASDMLYIYLNQGMGKFFLPLKIQLPTPQIYRISSGFLDDDAVTDLVFLNGDPNRGQVTVGFGEGSGEITMFSTLVHSSGTPSAVVLADMNNDKTLDIIVSSVNAAESEGLTVYLGKGDRRFASGGKFSCGPRWARAIAAGDTNGDGNADIVVANDQTSVVSVLLGNGRGELSAPKTYYVKGTPKNVAVGDLNGDSKLDLVTANWDDRNVAVLLNLGSDFADASFSRAAYVNSFDSVRLHDVNGDRRLDVITAEFISSKIGVLLGRGDGSFEAPISLGNGRYCDTGIGDFNGDQQPDIVAVGLDDNQITLFLSSE